MIPRLQRICVCDEIREIFEREFFLGFLVFVERPVIEESRDSCFNCM